MNKLRIGTIAVCALATFAGTIALKWNAAIDDERRNAPTVATAAAAPAGADSVLPIDNGMRQAPAVGSAAREILPQSDTTGQLQKYLVVEDLLNEIDADTGDDFTPIDREQFTALLKSDPELRKAIDE